MNTKCDNECGNPINYNVLHKGTIFSDDEKSCRTLIPIQIWSTPYFPYKYVFAVV